MSKKFSEYMEKSEVELHEEHLGLLREKVELAFREKDEGAEKLHLASQVRRNLARVKTALKMKKQADGQA